MTLPRYFEYLNAAGKMSSRAVQEVMAIMCVYLEEQEKRNEQYEADFKQIAEVLAKLVDKKIEAPVIDKPVDLKEFEKNAYVNPLVCITCGKECATSFGLQAHQRSHKPK